MNDKKELKMKTIGMLGGMSWESTNIYYHTINTKVRERLGGLNSAKIMLNSVNFFELEQHLAQSNWQSITQILTGEAKKLEKGGAECLIICTNTMHKAFDDIEAEISIPSLHIVDALGEKLIANKIKKIGLLGTKFTILEDFYYQRLKENFDIEAIMPPKDTLKITDNIIFNELCRGVIKETSKIEYLKIIKGLINNGAEATALACTEIELLIQQQDVDIMLFNTAEIHAGFAVDWALNH